MDIKVKDGWVIPVQHRRAVHVSLKGHGRYPHRNLRFPKKAEIEAEVALDRDRFTPIVPVRPTVALKRCQTNESLIKPVSREIITEGQSRPSRVYIQDTYNPKTKSWQLKVIG